MNIITLIADNGGGITLQVINVDTGAKYQHFYTHPLACCAEDVRCALNGDDVRDWDGNEAKAGWLSPTLNQIESGGYRVLDVGCAQDVLDWDDGSWLNISEMANLFVTSSEV